ncbi:MAG: response regulator, partial [Planctomycetota bacterium]
MSENRILIVDDSEENVVFMSQILEDHGYPYSVARNGAEAMQAMKEHRPSLVLLDIFMPRKSGVVVFKQMKQDPELEGVPIVIVTGASSVTGVDMKTGEQRPKEGYGDDVARDFGEVLREKLEGLTPDGFIEKPIHPATLVAKI